MKLVFVGPFGLQPKGTMSVRALPLARALVARGHSVTVLIPPWDDPARAGQTWVDEGVQVVNLPLPALAAPLRLTRALVVQALARQPDAIHFFKPKAYAGLAHWVCWWRRIAGRASPRLVLDIDDWEQAWNEVLPYPAWQKRLFAWQERWGLRHADAITAASRELAQLAAHERGGAGAIAYLPNGHRPEAEFAPAEGFSAETVCQQWQLGQGPVVLLYSRFAEFRLERIVTLVRLVSGQVPAARWLIVGEGLYGEHHRLAELLRQAGLLEGVRFTGWLPPAQLPACFAAATVAVHPYDDTRLNRTKCSVKLIDLLMAGLPVVADAVGQNREYIGDGESGVLTPPEDDGAFGAAIIALLQDPARQAELGQAAARRMRSEFGWLRLSAQAERMYV
jgi:glycosyltransferase involved in cell wall biosynthesis